MAARLPRRALGRTGLSVSILGFGASPLGSVFEEIDEARAARRARARARLPPLTRGSLVCVSRGRRRRASLRCTRRCGWA
jgi:hypothetical protein